MAVADDGLAPLVQDLWIGVRQGVGLRIQDSQQRWNVAGIRVWSRCRFAVFNTANLQR